MWDCSLRGQGKGNTKTAVFKIEGHEIYFTAEEIYIEVGLINYRGRTMRDWARRKIAYGKIAESMKQSRLTMVSKCNAAEAKVWKQEPSDAML